VRNSPEDPTMGAMRDDLLTAAELADRLRVKPATILSWQRSGQIPAVRLSHKVLRFSLDDALAALKRPTLGGEAKP
jgi:predicted site-specific integrase-resolvase